MQAILEPIQVDPCPFSFSQILDYSGSYNHSSFLNYITNYGLKMFYSIDPWAMQYKTFYSSK